MIGTEISVYENAPSTFNCLTLCIDNIECYAVQTSLNETNNKVKCSFRDNSSLSSLNQEMNSFDENFLLNGKINYCEYQLEYT